MSLNEILTSAIRRKSRNGNTTPPIVEVQALPHAETETRTKLYSVLRHLGNEMNSGPNAVRMDVFKMVAGDDDINELPDLVLAQTANGLCQILGREPVVYFGPLKQIVRIADLA